MFLYSAACIVVAAVPSLAGVLMGRLVSGFLSAIPTIIVAGSIEDMFDHEARIWMIFAWGVSANIGVAIGPIMGAYLAEDMGW
jgi:MFS family permease